MNRWKPSRAYTPLPPSASPVNSDSYSILLFWLTLHPKVPCAFSNVLRGTNMGRRDK
ncbi:hypothetical protein EMIT0215P_30468 [Pseudomonas serboccidentalis]